MGNYALPVRLYRVVGRPVCRRCLAELVGDEADAGVCGRCEDEIATECERARSTVAWFNGHERSVA